MAFLLDSYARTLSSVVVGCEPGEKPNTWNVILEDTVLFPEGGGQPCDVGTINGMKVDRVFNDKHGRIAHVVHQPLEIGAKADVELDWDRRFDHMTHHTAQHVISAIAEDMFGWKTTCWALGSKDVSVDLTQELSKMEPGQLDALERAVNAEIRRNKKVTVQNLPREEAFALTELRASAKCVPDTATMLRLVGIEEVDLNLCCGTHVHSLAEMQLIKFYGAESMRGCTRLLFRVGNRVLCSITSTLQLEKQLALALSCGPAEFVGKVDKIAGDAKSSMKEASSLKDELGKILGEQLANNLESGVGALHRSDGADIKFLMAIAEGATQKKADAVVLLTSGDDNGGMFLLSAPESIIKTLGPKVAQALGGKGGGGKSKYQGKYQSLKNIDDALALLRSAQPAC